MRHLHTALAVLGLASCAEPAVTRLQGVCGPLAVGTTTSVQLKYYDDTCCGRGGPVTSVVSNHQNVVQVVVTDLDAGRFDLQAVGPGIAQCVIGIPYEPSVVRFALTVVENSDAGAPDGGCTLLPER